MEPDVQGVTAKLGYVVPSSSNSVLILLTAIVQELESLIAHTGRISLGDETFGTPGLLTRKILQNCLKSLCN